MPAHNPIRAARCALHAGREAAARCPVCTRHFCRECVTEHHGRLLCFACLKEETTHRARRHSFLGLAMLCVAFCLMFAASVVMFYTAGRMIGHAAARADLGLFHEED
jgi:hypothetical protein